MSEEFVSGQWSVPDKALRVLVRVEELPKRIDLLSTSRATLVEILQPEPEHATPYQELTVDLAPTPPTPPPRQV